VPCSFYIFVMNDKEKYLKRDKVVIISPRFNFQRYVSVSSSPLLQVSSHLLSFERLIFSSLASLIFSSL